MSDGPSTGTKRNGESDLDHPAILAGRRWRIVENSEMGMLESFLRRHSGRFAGVVAAAIAVGVALAGGASGALKVPMPIGPANGAAVGAMPAFAWAPVAGAKEYEVQVAADSGFNSPVLGGGKDDFRTKNARATLTQTAPNGTYWWRVRAIGKNGTPSGWSQGRSFRKNWASRTTLVSPVGGAQITYPGTPLKLTWLPVPGARKYLVSVATDPALGSLITINGGTRPIETSATTFTPAAALAPGTYYWGITALDAEGNRGVSSAVGSFTWAWPSATTPQVTDLSPAPELFDPRFSWNPVPGAARYEVEINSTQEFALGSKVCCTGTTINTSLSPTTVFKNNTYYWRVRALDMDGHAGQWNVGPSFTKSFDNVSPAGPVPGTSIKNLRMRDNLADPGTDVDPVAAGYQTRVPVVRWDPVPGAASYEVQVAGWNGAACSWASTSYLKKTSVTEWTPLGYPGLNNPAPWQGTVAADSFPTVDPGTYCFRVRARSDRSPINQEIWGDYTYLQNGGTDSTVPAGPAFDWTGYPDPADPANSTPCLVGYPCAGDYLGPVTGTTTGRTPLFTWKPLMGARSYFVVVAKDANFTNVVDEGFTRVPAYAPRNTFVPTTYPDETTTYYWAVLPATAADGSDALPLGVPTSAVGSFQKRSAPPERVFPASGSVFLDQPRFQWTPVLGARNYRLQVSQDPSFGNPIDDVTTASTAYSSNSTYPADTILYWRVRANDENGVGLTWSNPVSGAWTFRKKLAAPVAVAGNPTRGDAIPNWSWTPVPGAVSYDFSVDQPDGTHRDFSGLRAPSATPVLMYGTGIFHWRVCAEFPKSPFGLTPGPYSATYSFTRTISEPSGAHADFDMNHILLSWNAKAGARRYRVQIAGTPDFAQPVENILTDNTSYAPTLRYSGWRTLNTGRLYWRVAAQDEGDNVGDFTQPQLITRIRKMEIAAQGALKHGKRTMLTITVSDFETAGGVGGVKVRAGGAGLRARTARTNVFGSAMMVLKPKRKGILVIKASKAGFQPISVRLRVR
jgi:hypothetical protein